ncbi:MAG: protein kinase domain-containing protein [Gemmataceae bacterium]
MSGSTDRNLLFGVLALQMNFVDRDGLIAGLNAWAAAKDRPLGGILLDQGRLTPAQCRALDAVLELHLEQHQNDAQLSLKALAAATTVGPRPDDVADFELQTSLRSLSTVSSVTARGDAAPPPERGGSRYRVLRPHARGGLGEVFVAEDTELHREVALKEIQPKWAGNAASRTRFVQEAEITGGLEHPGIVPVYGLGVYPDGRPYYAMRFIRGGSLKEAIEKFHATEGSGRESVERGMSLRGLLRRFIDVCNAIAYAHSRGVLHRDLKPANVMLGPFGETLVVDWGLAKAGLDKPYNPALAAEATIDPALRPESADQLATQAGSALGTPGYMSPEQATGKLNELGPATDIYGLGATLFALLSGRRPGDDAPFADTAPAEGAPVSPRARRTLPPALAAVCRKAMAPDPANRYSTALELAADVERWLADEPVAVHRDAWPVRAGRWVRRHRTAAVAAGVFLGCAVVALGASTGLIWREQRETAKQKNLAEDNLNRVRRLTENSVNLIAASEAEYAADPAKDRIRRDVLKSAAERYRGYLAENPADPEMRQRTALVYRYAANVHRLSWEAEPADRLYHDAIQISQALADQFPQERSHRQALADTLRDRASLMSNLGRLGEASSLLDRSIQINDELCAREPARTGYRRSLGAGLLSRAAVEHSRGRREESERTAGRAGEIFCELSSVPPPQGYHYDPLLFAAAMNVLALTQREAGQLDAADKLHGVSIRLMDGMYNSRGESVNNADVLHFLAVFQVERCRTWMQSGERPADVETNLGVAIQNWERLATAFPQVPMYPEYRAVALQVRGTFLTRADRPKEARADLELSQRLLEDLVARFGNVPGPRVELGRTYLALARLTRRIGDGPAAASALARAAEQLGRAVELAPDDDRARRALAEVNGEAVK